MDCARILFSGHALQRMFQRRIAKDAILEVIANGELIADYPDDRPYPSRMLLGWVDGRALHVVVARESENRTCYVVTTYEPDPGLWSDDFKMRR